jgi:thioredoxin-like negative regulator of GroEL
MSTVATIKNKATAKQFIEDCKNKSCIILYYWNSCGHCHQFMPIWNELKRYYDNDKIIYEVEYDDMKTLLPDNLQMFSYPSIVSYNNAKPINFNGASRTFENVREFINKTVKSITELKPSSSKPSLKPSLKPSSSKPSSSKPSSSRPLLLPPKPNKKRTI